MRKLGSTSFKDTIFGILPREKLVKLEEKGVKKGLEFIYRLIKKDSQIIVNSTLILKLHKISFAWIFPEWAGKFRKIEVQYSGKEAPNYYKVPLLIIDLCRDLDKRLRNLPNENSDEYITEIIELIAWFQHKFVAIHPFNDYNGRTARLLTALILLKLNIPPIEIKADTKNDRSRYIKALQKADIGEYSDLEKLINEALQESLTKSQA